MWRVKVPSISKNITSRIGFLMDEFEKYRIGNELGDRIGCYEINGQRYACDLFPYGSEYDDANGKYFLWTYNGEIYTAGVLFSFEELIDRMRELCGAKLRKVKR